MPHGLRDKKRMNLNDVKEYLLVIFFRGHCGKIEKQNSNIYSKYKV